MAGFIIPLEMLEKTRTGPQTKVHDRRMLSVELVKSSIFTSPVPNTLFVRESKAPQLIFLVSLRHNLPQSTSVWEVPNLLRMHLHILQKCKMPDIPHISDLIPIACLCQKGTRGPKQPENTETQVSTCTPWISRHPRIPTNVQNVRLPLG